MTDWTWERPGEGDTDGLLGAAVVFGDWARDAFDVARDFDVQRAYVRSLWTGESAEAWDAKFAATEAWLREIQVCAGPVSEAIKGYIWAVEDIKEVQGTWISRRMAAMETATARGWAWRWRWGNTSVFLEPVPLGRVQDPPEVRQMQITQDELDAAVRMLLGLAENRRLAEAQCIAKLDAAMPGAWTAEQAAFRTIKITSFDQMTASALGDALADFVTEKRTSGDGALTAEDIDALTLLLTTHGGQADVMSVFLTRLGGQGLLDLVDAIGETGSPAALPLARQLRSALQTVSDDWEAWQAEAFAASMFKNALPGNGWPLAISFLFDGPPYVGAELSLAAAEQVDTLERTHGVPFLEDPATQQPWTGGSVYPGSYLLIQADHRNDEEGFAAAHDAAGRILEALGSHPEHATKFLTDAKLGTERIEYWYEQRDWSRYDKFEGPSALFAGTQKTAGGPGNPRDPQDDAALTTAAELMTQIALGLDENRSFDTDKVNDNASLALAEALALNFATLWDSPGNDNSRSRFKKGDLFAEIALPGSNGTIPGSLLPLSVLKKLTGTAGSHGSGASVLSGAVEGYHMALLQIAANSGGTVDQQIRIVTDRLAEAQAMIDGSINAAARNDAAKADAATRKSISTVLSGIGVALAPLTFGSSAAGAMGAVATIELISQAAQTGGETLWATKYAQTQLNVQTSEDAQIIEAMRTIGSAATTLLGIDLPLPERGELSTTDHLSSVMNWFAQINERAINHPDPTQRMLPGADLNRALRDYSKERWGASE